MKVKMKQDQHYISVEGAKLCAFAGDIVDVDPLFAKYIKGKFDVVTEEKEPEKAPEKPLEKMNKDELIARARMSGIDLEDEQFEKLTKAEIIKLIQEVK